MSLSFWAGFACLEELSDGRSVKLQLSVCIQQEASSRYALTIVERVVAVKRKRAKRVRDLTGPNKNSVPQIRSEGEVPASVTKNCSPRH